MASDTSVVTAEKSGVDSQVRITRVSQSELHDGDDEALMIRKKESVVEGEGRGPGYTIRAWMNRITGRSASLYAVPQHWKEQMDEVASRDHQRLEKYYDKVAKINSLEAECRQMTDAELKAKTELFRKRIEEGEALDSVLVEAFAIVREASRRVINMRHYDCQLVGGMVLNDGLIAEMETGEGKTLVATLPVYLNACAGKSVHVITVNEYLADRDAKWMGRVYTFLGMSVAAIKSSMPLEQLKHCYAADIIYVTAQKLCFDYLHDWTSTSLDDMVASPLEYGIVDEVDSVLIDEARNPLKLSTQSEGVSTKIKICAEVVYELLEVQKYGILNTFGNQMKALETLSKQIPNRNVPLADICAVQDAVSNLTKLIDETSYRNPNIDDFGARDSSFMPKASASDEYRYELRYFRNSELLKAPETFRHALTFLLQFKPWAEERLLYKRDMRSHRVTVTARGADLLKEALENRDERVGGENGVALWEASSGGEPWGPYLTNAIKAYEFYILGKSYIVVNSRVVIVDASTGRTRNTSRWEQCLHQAVEAKEQVYQENGIDRDGVNRDERIEIGPVDGTSATITFQVFFRYYSKLAGMSGTALSEEAEFFETYGLSVVHVPTHRPSRRIDQPPMIFLKSGVKLRHLVAQLVQCRGVRPVLIGTNSVEESEALMENLKRNWVDDWNTVAWDGEDRYKRGKLLMLNARPERVKDESHIIAQAGLPGMVTVATSMAGRGTDILLGGNPKGLAENALQRVVLDHRGPDLEHSSTLLLPEFELSSDASTDVPAAITGLRLSALARGKSAEDKLDTSADAEALIAHVMQIAEDLRSKVLLQLKIAQIGSMHSLQLVQLNFERDVRMAIAEVLCEQEAALETVFPSKECPFLSPKTPLYVGEPFRAVARQVDTLFVALVRSKVRAAGGLLVVGMSVAESKRVENQLRGRAGRQGDPGDSIMLADLSDGLFKMWNLGPIRTLAESSPAGVREVFAGPMANFVIDGIRNQLVHLSRTSRREIANYDEVTEQFRQQYHFLKEIILKGTHAERTQLLYAWIQDVANDLVSSSTDSNRHPDTWTLWKPENDAQVESTGTTKTPPLEEAIDRMYNPAGRTSLFPFENVRKGQYPTLQEFFAVGVNGEEAFKQLFNRICSLPFVRVIPFTTFMKQDLIQALKTCIPRGFVHLLCIDDVHVLASLPKASAAEHFITGRLKLTLEIRHGLALHKKLIQQQGVSVEDNSRGRYAKQVKMLQEYVGELMIMLFEERKLQLVTDLAQADGFTKQNATRKFQIVQKFIMLQLLDTLWSDFLKLITRLRSTSLLLSVRNSPLQEFSIEAHKQFAAQLLLYRQAVVMSLISPSLHVMADEELNLWFDLAQSLCTDEARLPSTSTDSADALSSEIEALYSEQ